MTKPRDSTTTSRVLNSYEVRVAARLDPSWGDQFEGFTLSHDADGTTVLTGWSVDQAALHGVLQRIRDLGVPLSAVTSLIGSATPTSDQPTLPQGEGDTE